MWAKRRYCSRRCGSRGPRNVYPDLPDTKVCPTCGEEFSRPASYRNQQWAERKYCSRACMGKGKSAIYRARQPSATCPICGDEYQDTAARLRYRRTCRKPACIEEYTRTVLGPKRSARMRADYASGKRKPARGVSLHEEMLWPHLKDGGWKWRLRWRDFWGTFEIDFALDERKLAVEVDGENHRHTAARVARDRLRDAELKRRGWRILRIPNTDVDADPEGVAQRIIAWSDSPG